MFRKIFSILSFMSIVLFSASLLADPVKVRIVSKDLSADNEDQLRYMNLGVEALKKQGIDIELEIVSLTGGQSYREKLEFQESVSSNQFLYIGICQHLITYHTLSSST